MSEAGAMTRLIPLLRELSPADGDAAMARDRLARVAWTLLAEPGDGDAGLLVGALGAHAAWELVRSGAAPAELRRAAAERDAGRPERVWVEALSRWRPRLDPAALDRALRQAARFGMRLLVPGDEHWPAGVDDLGVHAPLALWVRGDVGRLAGIGRSVALVGARAATGYGEHVALELSSALVDRGFAVVSGGAYGVDAAAHRAALAGDGLTVAVLAGGLDRLYPAGHEQLLTRVVDRGVVLAEVPPGTPPTRWRFLQRNRLIAAIAAATVVVEAGWRSGALNTANHAAQLGRPLGAVPGPVTSAASVGCHRLLRENGAVCVTTPDEVAELAGLVEVPSARDSRMVSSGAGLDGAGYDPSGARIRLLDALSERSPRDPERIAVLSGLAPDRVRAQLGMLELDGMVLRSASGWLRRRTRPTARSSGDGGHSAQTG